MLNVPNEKVLVEQCQNQNRNAQRILFDRYFKKMMTICLRYLTNEQDALVKMVIFTGRVKVGTVLSLTVIVCI